MTKFVSLFTKERQILIAIVGAVGIIVVSIIGYYGSTYTARVQASAQVNKDISDFKVDTANRFGVIEGEVKTQKEVQKVLIENIVKRLENIDGALQSLTSRKLQETRSEVTGVLTGTVGDIIIDMSK